SAGIWARRRGPTAIARQRIQHNQQNHKGPQASQKGHRCLRIRNEQPVPSIPWSVGLFVDWKSWGSRKSWWWKKVRAKMEKVQGDRPKGNLGNSTFRHACRESVSGAALPPPFGKPSLIRSDQATLSSPASPQEKQAHTMTTKLSRCTTSS